MNSGGMADMLKAAMQKKKGDKDTFTMTGQYASPVMYDEETSREFVMYESPNGEQVKVFGNWNEYAVAQDEDGKDMIADEDYPIRKNENGEFVFDEAKFEEMQSSKPEQEMEQEMAPEPPAEKVRRMMMGGKIDEYAGGGYMTYDNGGYNDPEKKMKKTVRPNLNMKKTMRPNLKMNKTMRPMPMSEEQKAAMENLSREDLMRILKTAARS